MYTKYDARMKAYEKLASQAIPKELPMIIRVDGKAFHTYTKGLEKPHDPNITMVFALAAAATAKHIQMCELVYTQSDEVSFIVMNHLLGENGDPWFGGKVQKITSIAASIFTSYFSMYAMEFLPHKKQAFFDARTYPMPRDEIKNYLRWRQMDCTRNCWLGYGQYYIGKKQTHGLKVHEIKTLLNDLEGEHCIPSEAEINGWVAIKEPHTFMSTNRKTGEETEVKRSQWIIEAADKF